VPVGIRAGASWKNRGFEFMRPSSRTSSSGRQSWRDARRQPHSPPTGKHAARWLLSVISLVLAAALTMLLLQGCSPEGRTHLAVLQVSYGAGTTPPIYFAGSDADYLEQHLEQRASQILQADRGKWIALRESSSMHRLAENLAELQLGDPDRLVLFVSAHGISDGDQAYLLGSELDLKQSSSTAGAEARYPLRDFLRQLADAPGNFKLLILDWGRIHFDPRLGVARNEFPRLLEEQVKELDDPRLWVLTSHSDNEPAVDFANGYSLFARAVAEGLGGAADAHPRDRNVTLAELYSYVVARCDAWYPPRDALISRPQLLRGGEGRVASVAAARDLRVLRVLPPTTPAPAPEATDEDAEPPSGQPPRTEDGLVSRAAAEVGRQVTRDVQSAVGRVPLVSRGQSVTSRGRSNLDRLRQALPAPPPTTSSEAPPEKPDDEADVPAQELVDAAVPADESPTVAPEIAETQPAPPTRRPPDLAQLLADEQLELEKLDEGDQAVLAVLLRLWWLRDQLHQRRNPLEASPVDFAPHRWRDLNARLLVAEQQFLAGDDAAGLTETLLELLRECEELQGALAGNATTRSGGSPGRWTSLWNEYRRSPQFADQDSDDERMREAVSADRHLRTAMFELSWYRDWQAAELAASNVLGAPREIRDQVRRCRGLAQLLDSLGGRPLEESSLPLIRDRLRQVQEGEKVLQQSLVRQVDQAWQAETSSVRQRHLATLLSTPLLDAPRRCQALAALLVPGDDRSVPADWPLTPSAEPRWREVDDSARQLTLMTREMLELTGTTDLAALEAIDSLRDWGNRLREEWTALAQVSTRGAADNSDRPAGDPFRKLLLADSRDLLVDHVFPDSRLQPPARPAQLAIVDFSPPVLSLDNWERVVVPVTAEGTVGEELTLSLKFPVELVQVAEGTSSQPGPGAEPDQLIRPDQPLLVRRTDTAAGAAWELSFFVRALATATPRVALARLDLTMSTSGVAPQTKPLDLSLPPPPNQVRLLVRREEAAMEQELPGGIRLRPHPNRATGYEFYLVNESLQPRKVSVELLRAVRPPATVRRAPGRFFDGVTFDGRLGRLMLTDEGRIRPDLRRTRRLLATPEAVSLPGDLEQVRVALISAEAQAARRPDDAEREPAAPPPTWDPVDVSDGLVCVITDVDRPQEQWIHWLEIYPLAPRNYLQAQARYEAGRIAVTVRPGDRTLCPVSLGEEGAIPIFLHSAEMNVEANQAARIESLDQPPAEVWLAAPQDQQRRTVWLDVDGVPRAFGFQVVCQTGARGDDLRQQEWNIDIRQLATDPEDPRPAVRDRERPMAFRVDQTLWVDLHVDMPINAFEGATHEDVIEIGMGEESPIRFFADRAARTQLLEVRDGTLVLHTTVTDHRVPFDITGRRGNIRLAARATYRGSEKRDLVPFILDGDPPRVTRLSFSGSTIPHGTKLPVQVTAEDAGSGVAVIRLGFDRNGNGQLDEADQPIDLEQAFGTVQLDTSELQVGRTYRVLAQAEDRVGLTSSLEQREIQIVPPREEKKDTPPTKGNIRGVVLFGGVAAVSRNLVTVSIEGSGIPPVRTGAGGSFEFRDVPAGTYTLKASGSFSGMACVGELRDVMVPSRERVVLSVNRP
jgi:hypothetical protein